MTFFGQQGKNFIRLGLFSLAGFLLTFPLAVKTQAKSVVEKRAALGTIKGIVRDDQGKPISEAIVALFYLGTSKLFKQVRSSSDGRFLTKVMPGKYTLLAVAQGFNASLSEVQVGQSAEVDYGFKLERVGSGNTLPEKRIDRKSSKWMVRAAQNQRSIYQANEGESPIEENKALARQDIQENLRFVEDEEPDRKRDGQSVVETYFADSEDGNYTGLNFATLQPLGEDSEIIIAGQTGTGKISPQRLEAALKTRLNENHQVKITTSAANFGKVAESDKQLGQLSFQALDEWQVKDGVILVLGFDYSRLVGAGSDSALNPRLGLQVDVNAKTRLRTAYTTQTEDLSWADAIDLEGSQVLFRNQFSPRTFAVENEKPLMSKSRRLEFGVERVLDNSSSIEATTFFDSVTGRGVGLMNVSPNVLDAEAFSPFVATQSGNTQGVRVVYSRRLNKIFSASAGYAFGNGQKISEAAATPADIFSNGYFQNFVGQLNADLKTGTQVKTIYRLSPQATVFAIDPFQGRMAIYDPGLSVMVTQSLPTLGLPIRAEAVVDARNLFDSQLGMSGEESSLRINSQRRILRGGILVRF